MKIYGYASRKCEEPGLLEMSEITFVAEPSILKQIAEYLLETASNMEKWGGKFGHSHLRDGFDGWDESWPDIVISK